jgi:hypothetical protein
MFEPNIFIFTLQTRKNSFNRFMDGLLWYNKGTASPD